MRGNFQPHVSAESPSNISPNPTEIISEVLEPMDHFGNFAFQKSSRDSETSDMTSDGLGEMFEGDSADPCAGKILLMSMGGRAEGLACADAGARTPIGVGRILIFFFPVPVTKIPEGVVVGFPNFAWAPN